MLLTCWSLQLSHSIHWLIAFTFVTSMATSWDSLMPSRQSVLQSNATRAGGHDSPRASFQSLCCVMVSGGCVECCRCPRILYIAFGSKLHIRLKALLNGFSTGPLIFFTVGPASHSDPIRPPTAVDQIKPRYQGRFVPLPLQNLPKGPFKSDQQNHSVQSQNDCACLKEEPPDRHSFQESAS